MRKLNITIVVGIVVAVIGAGLVFVYGHNVDNKISAGKHTVSVLVADEVLGAGMTAGDVVSHVHVAQIPDAYVVKNAIAATTSLSAPSAQNAVLVGSVPQGGQLSYYDFSSASSASHLAPSKGNVALSVETPISSGVARYLQPGQLVDVFATYTANAGAKTKLFVSGVKVLSVSIAQVTTNSSSNNDSTDANGQPSGSVVVLLDVSPRNAQKVVNAVSAGTIYLAYTTSTSDKTPTTDDSTSVLASNR